MKRAKRPKAEKSEGWKLVSALAFFFHIDTKTYKETPIAFGPLDRDEAKTIADAIDLLLSRRYKRGFNDGWREGAARDREQRAETRRPSRGKK